MSAVGSTPTRPSSSARRSSHRGVAMSLEMRPPRELLEQIGINGKEVVKIIKDRDWDIEEPHGLQQQKLYYLPGTKGDQTARQNQHFFVGEGELYAFILKQGGLRYLLPDEDHSEGSEVEATQSSKLEGETPAASAESDVSAKSSALTCETPGRRKWKRRKKLSTARSKSVEKTEKVKTPPLKRQRKKINPTEEDEQDRIRVDPQVKIEQATYGGIGQQAEFSEYEASWTARGWRAQLLQDVDVHLLRSVAAVDRQHRAFEASNEGQKKSAGPTEGPGPHAQDPSEILQELGGLLASIRASQDDLSTMIESMIVQGERSTIPDRIDPTARIGIPGFVSTGPGSLVLMRDMERYLLLCVAAIRRYQRTRKAISANESSNGFSQSSRHAVKRADLRALQLSIEESKSELQELATIIAAGVSQACQETSQDTTEDTTSQRTEVRDSQFASQNTSRTTDCDNTDHDQFSSQQSVSSPRRLEGGQWFV
ncbi:hypothetical protein PHMEG_00011705 [Phytophthora megakarya]|uniref:Uncharacterized protein n=1 Tax=Phytophthora megakarya TaxID=4795 RepID=A0A225WAX1_9STRA|nr:hypothetical protein PHMEG_00011705 [Phytophthora megakarya]